MCTYHSPWQANFVVIIFPAPVTLLTMCKFSRDKINSDQEVERCCTGVSSQSYFSHYQFFQLFLWPPLPHHYATLTHCPRASFPHQFLLLPHKTQGHKCQWALHFRVDILSADKFYAAVVFLQPRLKISKSGTVLCYIAYPASHKSSTHKLS